VYYR
jgi:transposase